LRRNEGRRDWSGPRRGRNKRRLSRANGLDTRVGLRRRRRVILPQQPTPERLECVQRTGPVSGSVQQLDEPCEGGFVVEIERDSLARRARRGREIAVPLGALRNLRRRSSRQATQAQALALDPALELRGSIVDEKAGEEVTAIELERSCRFPSVTRLLERERVKPQRRWLEADFFVTVTIEDAVAQLATEKPQRLAQRPTGVRRVELGPKQCNHGIAAGTGSVNGEIGEKGEALRLGEDRMDRMSVGRLQVQRPQRPQLDHALNRPRQRRRRRPSHTSVTAESLAGASVLNVRRRGVPARAFPASGRGRLARGGR